MNNENVKQNNFDVINYESLLEIFNESTIPENEKLYHLGLFTKRQPMSRFLFMYEIYKRIIDVHGVIFEFGVRWGQDLAWYENFRGIFEPYNYNRRVVGFDTFEGFPSVSGYEANSKAGDFSVTKGYENELERILSIHSENNPISHMKKHELVKGDATITVEKYLKEHPETIISFAYFDFDIYEPTKVCLELCKNHFVKGSIIGFDEVNHPDWPGETVALKEVFGLNNIKLERVPFSPTQSFFVVQ
jgi:hypothetical protein